MPRLVSEVMVEPVGWHASLSLTNAWILDAQKGDGWIPGVQTCGTLLPFMVLGNSAGDTLPACPCLALRAKNTS